MLRSTILAGILAATIAAPAVADPMVELSTNTMRPMLMQTSTRTNLDGSVQYALGDRLPNSSERIRDYRSYRLSPPPFGAYYARINQDLVLVRADTDRIINLVGLVFTAS